MPQLPPQRDHAHVDARPRGKRLAILSLTALGIVYGDIGTSPLYAFREAFVGHHPYPATQENVYGVLSLITWALIGIVSIKYLILVVKADNRGEGGMMSLLALVLQHERREDDKRKRALLVLAALFGTALLLGDGMITPAVSVLSAVEGLKIATPALSPFVLFIAIAILVGLFSLQRFGTARVGVFFGPVTLVWFVTIAVLGLLEILREPSVLAALSPHHAAAFFYVNGAKGFFILGAVVLAVTGAEALYADMGHFGKRPIRVAWLAVALPCLMLNYYGQGALILRDATAAANPFYLLVPDQLLYPMVALATASTIVASQAMISGAYSLAQQCVQLGYSPRLTIIHTSYKQAGQIYVPEVNKMIAVGCLMLVLYFKTSERLTAAYGIAVTGAFAITTILFAIVASRKWNWPASWVTAFVTIFLLIDISLFSANALKITSGGWVAILIALVFFTLMSTWKRGRTMLNRILQAGSLPTELFLDDVARKKPPRVPGTAVFMTSSADGMPVVLLHHLKHNKVLHEQVVLMSIKTEDFPEVPSDERLTLEKLAHGFYRVHARYGFMETPDVPEILYRLRQAGLKARQNETTFYLGNERLLVLDRKRGPRAGTRTAPDDMTMNMARWRKKLYVLMQRNARSATEFFGIPPNRVVELGAQVEF
ncbi:MAG TPA: potassium transporter Kup [Gemmatimonadaceae bacterium]|nr:potassium transporter Kup [Gemmatimonadaceae bacterium]